MNTNKIMWYGVLLVIVLYAVGTGVSRHMLMKRLSHDLRHGDSIAQVQAAKELMRRDRLFDRLQEMPVEDRIEAMSVIEQIPGESTVRQALMLLKDREEDVRKRVTESLVILGGDHIGLLVDYIKDSDANVRNGVKDALAEIGEETIPLLKTAVTKPDLRTHAADVLVKIGDASVPALVDLLREGDHDVRMVSARSLGQIGSEDGTPALIAATKDVRAVRQIAISSLCSIHDPRSTDTLVEVLRSNRDDGEVRARSATALSAIGGQRAVSALADALDDYDLKVRTSAITGLQRIGSPAVGTIVARMAEGSNDVRHAGAKALEKIDSPESAAVLTRLLSDADPIVRTSAARGIGNQSSGVRPDLLLPLLSDSAGAVGDAASSTLADMDARAVPILISVLSSASSDLAKYRAADALSKMGSQAVPALISILGKDTETSKWAAHTLSRIRDPRVEPELRKLIGASDPDLAWIVERALDRM